jgi:hypothetical protein
LTPTTRTRLTRRPRKGMRRTYLPGEEEEPLLCSNVKSTFFQDRSFRFAAFVPKKIEYIHF